MPCSGGNGSPRKRRCAKSWPRSRATFRPATSWPLLLTQSGRMAQAREEYLRSLADDPGQARVYLQLGPYSPSGKQDGRSPPEFRPGLRHFARLRRSLQRHGPGRGPGRESGPSPGMVRTRRWPSIPIFRRVSPRGDLYYERGDFASALVQYEEAAAKSPDDFRSLVQAGNCLRRLGRPGEGRSGFSEGGASRQEILGALLHLACLYALGGDTGRSAAAMRQSLKRGFKFADPPDRRRRSFGFAAVERISPDSEDRPGAPARRRDR